MAFAADTELALVVAAALINTRLGDVDTLDDLAGLDDFLARYPFTGTFARDEHELDGVRQLRGVLREVWQAPDRPRAAALVNDLLSAVRALPQLVVHDELDWHVHATRPDAPLADRMGAEAAMAFVDIIRMHELDRLRVCAADDCSAVLIDLSRNSSRLYCDTGNCANRAHVAAYRARRRQLTTAEDQLQ